MDTRIKLAKYKEREQLYSMVRGTGSGVKELAVEVLRNPLFSLILANVAIEALQHIKIKTRLPGAYPIGTEPPYQETPLLSQAHATTLETIINTTAALDALSANSGLLAGLAKLVTK